MSIKLYIGCMFSGKTSQIQREYMRWVNINKSVIMINYDKDTRYGDDEYVYNHDLIKVPCIRTDMLHKIPDDLLSKMNVIIINEGQFFNDIVEFALKWCEEKHKDIIICALDGDYRREPFGQIYKLIPLADDIYKLTAFCKLCGDGTKAIFTKRLIECDQQELIGSNDKYMAVCRKHYNCVSSSSNINTSESSSDSL